MNLKKVDRIRSLVRVKTEQIVAVVPGAESTDRIVIALDTSPATQNGGEKPISIRSESFSPDVGWFPQSVLKLSRSELAGLRNILGVPVSKACQLAMESIEEAKSEEEPRILAFAEYRRA